MKPTKEHFEYLDVLRDTGITNMFGAIPYLQNAFEIDRQSARDILQAWQKTFDPNKSAEDRVMASEECPGVVSRAELHLRYMRGGE